MSIIIKEYDNTNKALLNSDQFAVVVPGFVGTPAPGYDPAKVFDSNGIYKCQNQKDFERYVGKKAKVDTTTAAVGVDASAVVMKKKTSEAGGITAEEFYETYKNKKYLRAEDTTVSDVGYLISKIDNKYYRYTKVDKKLSEYANGTEFYIIENNNLGKDGSVVTNYGNQIAYELLGLGYTVYFKKLTAITDINDDKFACLKDRSLYDFRYIMTGCLDGTGNDVIKNVVNYINDAENNGRGECTALCEIAESTYASGTEDTILTAMKAAAIKNSYCGNFAPYVEYEMKDDPIYNNKKFPCAFHYLACAAKAMNNNFAEWYAVAGYQRGISDYKITKVGHLFGDAALKVLQPREVVTGTTSTAVNIITKCKDAYYLWGSRTGLELTDAGLKALNYLNIRQLVNSIKKTVYYACKKYSFDPNTDVLWINFYNAITPLLEKMKADQGIEDYNVSKVVDATKGKLSALIRIVPIEPVDDFEINISLEDSLTDEIVVGEN